MNIQQHTSNLQLKKFSSQADPAILQAMHTIADEEGRRFQAVLDEAMRNYIAAKESGQSRKPVMRAFDASLKAHDALYHKLAK